jgi:hypothetical protein
MMGGIVTGENRAAAQENSPATSCLRARFCFAISSVCPTARPLMTLSSPK